MSRYFVIEIDPVVPLIAVYISVRIDCNREADECISAISLTYFQRQVVTFHGSGLSGQCCNACIRSSIQL